MGKRGEKLVNVGKSGESWKKWGKSWEKWWKSAESGEKLEKVGKKCFFKFWTKWPPADILDVRK